MSEAFVDVDVAWVPRKVVWLVAQLDILAGSSSAINCLFS